APAAAVTLEDALRGLGGSAEDALGEAVRRIGALDDPRALPALEALIDDRLRVAADGRVFIWDSRRHDALAPLTGQVVTPRPEGLKEIESNNEIKRAVAPVLAQLQLGAPDDAVRLAAAQELAQEATNAGSPELATLLHRA